MKGIIGRFGMALGKISLAEEGEVVTSKKANECDSVGGGKSGEEARLGLGTWIGELPKQRKSNRRQCREIPHHTCRRGDSSRWSYTG